MDIIIIIKAITEEKQVICKKLKKLKFIFQ